ncbi:MAG: hypothetical protein CMJ77_04235 [Planctomycetaceae bacterium]|nr:hypothetical protein [Planctomycetaceae bacterium]
MNNPNACGSSTHLNRRTLLKLAGASGMGWLTPVSEILAATTEKSGDRHAPAKSIILLWLSGGPSQLETFDPHPNQEIAAGTTAIKSSVDGIQLASGMQHTAELMEHIAVVRSVVSREGDHERAAYNVKTGYRPDPTIVHPSIGAIVCHQLPLGKTEIPRHISILPDARSGRGGYLGDQFDAFRLGDPDQPLRDLRRRTDKERFEQRLKNLDVVERAFAKGRIANLEQNRTLHKTIMNEAVTMMNSEQLRAFDLSEVPSAELVAFGDSAFGRGCLVAARLIETGVRCIEVTLRGWDSHVSNHEIHQAKVQELDPALAALIRHLRERSLLDETLVICGGEFGRTPQMNPAGGRDHWPHGFSIALAGGGIQGGQVIGETDPAGSRLPYEAGIPVENIHATALNALGIRSELELETPIGRPLKLCEGQIIPGLRRS